MQINILDVEHGSCALVTTDNKKHILVDAGHNISTGWRPSTYLPSIGVHYLEKLIITNYDEEHATDLHNLVKKGGIGILTRNRGVTPDQLTKLKGLEVGPGIEALIELMNEYTGDVTVAVKTMPASPSSTSAIATPPSLTRTTSA